MTYRVSTNLQEMDIALISNFIANSYWAENRPQAVMEKAMQNSICFAVFKENQQIGFARVVTDKAVFGYLADVFVVEEYQRQGAAKFLLDAVMAHADIRNLRRFMLVTRDAQKLYRQFGFTDLEHPRRVMELVDNTPYDRVDE